MELTQEQITELLKRQYITYEIKGTEKLRQERAIVHYITTPDVDRMRDIVNPKGGNLEEFKAGARTVFYNHNYDKPIGKNVDIKPTEGGIKAKTVFAKTTALADDIYNLHLEGVIASWSIGFDLPRNKQGFIEEGAVEFDDKKNIRIFNKWKLLEYSSAPLAANPYALDQAKAIIKSAEVLKEITDYENNLNLEKEFVSKQEFEELKALYAELKNTADKTTEALKKEIETISKRLVHRTVNTGISAEEKDRLLKAAISRQLSDLTGKKINL